MFRVITVEGVRIRARVIPRMRLLAAWKKVSKEPFPRIGAFQLSDGDFDRVMMLGQKSEEDELRELVEWGRVLSVEGTDASVCNADAFVGVDYIVLVRENPYHTLDEILEHELGHVARGDL